MSRPAPHPRPLHLTVALALAALAAIDLLTACADDGDGAPPAADAAPEADAAPPDAAPPAPDPAPADPLATPETRALFRNLRKLAADATIMFGQEFATDMGRVDGTNDTFDQSDVADVVGQHPAVHGSDFHYILYKPWEAKLHVDAVKAAHARGAVVVFDFHMYGRYEETFAATPANAALVHEIVTDTAGSRTWFLDQLDQVAATVKDLGFPIVFRPFHEMSGDWFWWGAAAPGDFVALYRLTVEHFAARGVHNVLWGWSTNRTPSFEYYPGDAYVDVVGTDGYEPGSVPWFTTADMVDTLGELSRFAAAHGKVAAFTEVGQRNDYAKTEPDFWTKAVLAPILADADARHIAWIMTWINNTWSGPYVPYLGMPETAAVDDFVSFFEHPQTLFEDDLPPMYQ
jgi:mannan endo-1,4-beta-mannosidase